LADTALAGLPRIVRAGAEVRWRGQVLVYVGTASACFWAIVWLVEGPVRPLEAGIVFAAALLMALALGGITSRRRLAHGMQSLRRPRSVVHETLADSRERRVRASTTIFLGAAVLLVLDTALGQVGATAALLAGAGVGAGVVDLREARRWDRAEDERRSRIYLMLRPTALLVRLGVQDAYELPRPDRDDPEPEGFL
jgi:hypothetical protein